MSIEKLCSKFRKRRLIYILFQNQMAIINIGDEEIEAKIKKGVRQGCVLSPMIFNLYVFLYVLLCRRSDERIQRQN